MAIPWQSSLITSFAHHRLQQLHRCFRKQLLELVGHVLVFLLPTCDFQTSQHQLLVLLSSFQLSNELHPHIIGHVGTIVTNCDFHFTQLAMCESAPIAMPPHLASMLSQHSQRHNWLQIILCQQRSAHLRHPQLCFSSCRLYLCWDRLHPLSLIIGSSKDMRGP